MRTRVRRSKTSYSCAGCKGEEQNQRSFKMHTNYAFKMQFPSSHPSKAYLFLNTILLLKLLVILMSDMIHFAGGSWDFTKMHTLAMSSSSSSAMFRSRLFLNGSSSSVTNQSQSQNGAYEGPYSSSQLGTSNQGRIGSGDSFSDTHQSNSANLLVLILNMQSASTRRLLGTTSHCFKIFWMSWRYLRRMSGTWMRRAVNEEEGGNNLQKSTSSQEASGRHTAKKVGILNWSQFSNVSMLLVIQSNLGSYFLGNSFTENGWLLIQISGKSQEEYCIYPNNS